MELQQTLDEQVAELPPEDQALLREIVDFLLAKRQPERGGRVRQYWAEALRSYRARDTDEVETFFDSLLATQ